MTKFSWLTESIILPVLTGLGAWFAARRKNRAETKGIEIGNKKSEIEANELVIEALERNVELLNKRVVELLAVVEKMHSENMNLTQEVYLLRYEILNLKNEKGINTNIDHKP